MVKCTVLKWNRIQENNDGAIEQWNTLLWGIKITGFEVYYKNNFFQKKLNNMIMAGTITELVKESLNPHTKIITKFMLLPFSKSITNI